MESAAVLSATCPSWREIEPIATYNKSGSIRYRSVTPLLCKSLRRKPDKRDKLAAPYTRRGNLKSVSTLSSFGMDLNKLNGLEMLLDQSSVGNSVDLEMEKYTDLAPFLSTTTLATLNATDELNTPIFDKKGPFNFMVTENTYIESPPAADLFKFDCDPNRTGNSAISNEQLKDISVYTNNMSVQEQEHNSEVVNIIQGSEADNILFATSDGQENIYIINENGTSIHLQNEDLSASIYKIDDTNSVISVNSNEQQYSNVSSPDNEYSMTTSIRNIEEQLSSPSNLGIETPEDSNSGCPTMEVDSSFLKFLSLKLPIQFDDTAVLKTPDVIDSLVDLETNFNIFDYATNSKNSTIKLEDIRCDFPSTSNQVEASTLDEDISPKSRKRKRCYDDDDEDYIPPSKRQLKQELSDSDSETDQTTVRNSKRGRPPRRTSSVSSEHSDASKYRELRDKNNEASRKSRLKRKIKELEVQGEADELEMRNTQLKAKVHEVEKMVKHFEALLTKLAK